MLEVVIAFFVVAGAAVMFAGLKLVGLREAPLASAGTDIESLGLDELKALLRATVEDVQHLQDAYAQLERDDQQIREMVLGDRLASRDAVLTLIRRDSKLQQGVAAIELRLRHIESDSEPERVSPRGERAPRLVAASATT
jgi:uncharacterized iron-regulated protein